ncbi:MAG: hypothetical protein HC916_17725 [Coleofasciculaceae cyanobacterium SM2_1_6]|nr:hypothetical protein [Coleofasciculaceae cyanobacterium SM2_1_6]
MDPITTTFVTALAVPVSKDIITDGYKALKAALKKKFGEGSDVVDAVEKLEKKPDSEARKAAVQEEVATAKVSEDPEIIKLAEELLKQIVVEEPAIASKYNIKFGGEVKGAQVGDRNTQTNTFS